MLFLPEKETAFEMGENGSASEQKKLPVREQRNNAINAARKTQESGSGANGFVKKNIVECDSFVVCCRPSWAEWRNRTKGPSGSFRPFRTARGRRRCWNSRTARCAFVLCSQEIFVVIFCLESFANFYWTDFAISYAETTKCYLQVSLDKEVVLREIQDCPAHKVPREVRWDLLARQGSLDPQARQEALAQQVGWALQDFREFLDHVGRLEGQDP